ncbi:hypothetical protein K490DRAFT_51715, partial [Saccharata proteae CBS 121410]
YSELQSLSEGLHLFCPRDELDDETVYLEEDLPYKLEDEDEATKQKRLQKLKEADTRRGLVLDCMSIFAFDGQDATAYQDWLRQRLNTVLTNCDVCVRLYHRARSDLRHRLEASYDTEEVSDFMAVLDRINLDRITDGLDQAANSLRNAPPESRGVQALDSKGLYALFEALSCEALLKDEALLAKHFDEPFRLVQTKKKLRLGNYVPAMASFIFSQNEHRYLWAHLNWTKLKRAPTRTEFEGALQEPLFNAMKRVHISNVDHDFLPTFWAGARIIVGKLDKELITHSLRAMEIDICKLSLEHLRFNFTGFVDLVSTMQMLLEKAALDFWDAMGAISPVTIMEQVFNNKSLEQILLHAGSQDGYDEKCLDEIFGWVTPFLSSIKTANQTPVCRALTNQLLGRIQDDRYPRASRAYCDKLGIRVMHQTLTKLNEGKSRATFVGYAIVVDTLDCVADHMESILASVKVASTLQQPSEIAELGTSVVELALALECVALEVDREPINRGEQLQHDLKTDVSRVWDATAKAIAPGDIMLASKALTGTASLIGMEKFVTKERQHMPKAMNWFNNTLYTLSRSVAGILERVSDFSPNDLNKLFERQNTAHSVIMCLFSSEKDTREAAVEVLKNVSSLDTRRDAVRHILSEFYPNTIKSVARTLRRIATKKNFQPCLGMLRILTDIVDALCSPEDGLFRTMTLDAEEARVTEYFWQATWQVLNMIYEETERWAEVQDKGLMMNFCRDTMQFSDRFFDEYAHFANSITNAAGTAQDSSHLLRNPQTAMNGMVKWLRLRDEYLITKAVALTTKLLVRLRDSSFEITEDTAIFLEEIATKTVRSKLTGSQQAELERAFEHHTGRGFTKIQPAAKKGQQGTIAGWVSAATSAKGSPLGSSDAADDSDQLAKILSKSSSTADAWKARHQVAQKSRVVPKEAPKPDMSEFKRRREAEKEAKRKRDLEAIQRAKKNLPLVGVAAQTAEAGSGVRGLGVTARDHSAKGEGVMVSSDESEDDDEDEIDAELFGPSIKKTLKPKVKAPLLPAGPVKKKRVVRSYKDMRARLAPDLSSLHRTILGWEFFHDGDFPPNSRPDMYMAVPKSFMTPQDYQRTFQPLLTLEAWQGFVKDREEGSFKSYEIKISNRSNVDAFLEVATTMSGADNKELQIGEGDICLLSKDPKPADSPDAPHCLARVHKIKRKAQYLDVLYRIVPGSKLVPSLVPNGVVHGVKIQSITPLEREYGALQGLQYYDLCDEIIKARPSPLLKYGNQQLEPLIDNYKVNRAQAKAIKSAVDNDAFTLIQGPPGSGKTKTIVAIVGAILTNALRNTQATTIDKPRPASLAVAQTRNDGPAPKKLLVCAPSNAAVDELVMRLKEGVRTTSGQDRKINVVRLGRSDAMNVNVKDVTLDELVNARLNTFPGSGDSNKQREDTGKLMREHQAVSESLREARAKLDTGEEGRSEADLKADFDQLKRRKMQLGSMIDSAKDNRDTMNQQAELNRRKAQQEILTESHVICATLSGSGHDMFQNLNIEFETVIVDEAAQCVEMSALIPLKYGCAKAIFVGDPKQLPPTVFSKEAARFQYEQSLFVRMQGNHPDDVHLLDTQYRMHPEISLFPSRTFYDGKLLDGADMQALRARPWHRSAVLGPYRFFDVQGQHQAAPKGHSLINLAEIDVAMKLFERLTGDFRAFDFRGKIGIITPYKSQLRELKNRFMRKYGETVFETIEFNTTDAFQGRESEVIIFSCVRASPAGGIGFLQDIRRMNVGLTRAKSSLWVLGNSQSLVRGEFWRKLVEDAKSRDRYTQGNLMQMLSRPSSTYTAPSKPVGAARPSNDPVKAVPVAKTESEDVEMDGNDYEPKSATLSPASNGTASAMDDELFGDNFNAKKRKASSAEDVRMEDVPPAANANGNGEANGQQVQHAAGSHIRAPAAVGSTSAGASRPRMVPPKRRREPDNPLRQRPVPKKPRG